MQRAGSAIASFCRKAYEDNLTGLAAMVAYNVSALRLGTSALFVLIALSGSTCSR